MGGSVSSDLICIVVVRDSLVMLRLLTIHAMMLIYDFKNFQHLTSFSALWWSLLIVFFFGLGE